MILKMTYYIAFQVEHLIMDNDTSGSNALHMVFPEFQITYCGNHSAKTFHKELVNLKAIPCKVGTYVHIIYIIHIHTYMMYLYVNILHTHIVLT